MEIRKRNSGFTIAEVLVAASLSLILCLLAASLFVAATRFLGDSSVSYSVSRDFSLGLDAIRAGLKETALGTIRTTKTADSPGVSFVTPYSADGVVQVDPSGAPRWQGWRHYFLEHKSGEVTGSLVQWTERKDDLLIPTASLTSPFSVPDGADRRVILRDVVVPGATLEGLSDTPMEIAEDDGFSVKFLRHAEDEYKTSDDNPAIFTGLGKDLEGNTRLVEVTLRTFTEMQTQGSNTLMVRFKVAPRF